MQQIQIQPFVKIDGLDKNTYEFYAVSSGKKELQDKERYQIILKYNPYDKLINQECECKDFVFNRKKVSACKHIKSCIDILKEWREIDGN